MSAFVLFARRAAAVALGAGAVLTAATGTASAAPAGCTAGDITAVESQVAAGMAGYFFTHPDVNNFFSGLQGLSKDDAAAQTKSYLDANPQTKAEIKAIRGPVLDLRARCNIPTSSLIRGVL
jgi:hemophore-related protein